MCKSRLLIVCCFFFFFKQKTAYEMRISDWSSDVCSSDLIADGQCEAVARLWGNAAFAIDGDDALTQALRFNLFQLHQSASRSASHSIAAKEIGRASCRERVCQYV